MSKMGKLGSFFKKVSHVAPLILAVTPLAPIAPFVAAGIQEAEAIGGSGPDKLVHVVNIAKAAADAANAQAGKTVIDPALVEASAASTVSAIVQISNLLEQTPVR